METIGFKIWYSDAYILGDTYEHWCSSPDGDVQLVLLYFGGHYRQLAIGNDYYALTEDLKLAHGDVFNELQGHVKYGGWTSQENIDRILQEASNDYEVK